MIESKEELFHIKDGKAPSVNDLTQNELFLYSIEYFHDSFEKRAEMGGQTALWTNRVIRSGIFGLMLIATSILLLVVLVSQEMTKISDMMVMLDSHMEHIVSDTQNMSTHVHAMGESVGTLPPLVKEISIMQTHVEKISNDMVKVSSQMDYSSQIVENVIYDVEGMDRNLNAVSDIVDSMNKNINTVSRPFRLFNKMMPFP